jgi:hypothetical protein
MNMLAFLLLLYPIRLYYQRKWEGKRPGDELDIEWVCKRVKFCIARGRVIKCVYDRPRKTHGFLVQDGVQLEWHFRRFDPFKGWVVAERSSNIVSQASRQLTPHHPS